MNIGGHLALSATFKALFLHFTVEKLPSTFSVLSSPPSHHGAEANQRKRLACHPSISGLLRRAYNDLFNHISIADASICYSFLMQLPHFPFSLRSLPSNLPNHWYWLHIIFKSSFSFTLFINFFKDAFLLNCYLSPKSCTVLQWHIKNNSDRKSRVLLGHRV